MNKSSRRSFARKRDRVTATGREILAGGRIRWNFLNGTDAALFRPRHAKAQASNTKSIKELPYRPCRLVMSTRRVAELGREYR